MYSCFQETTLHEVAQDGAKARRISERYAGYATSCHRFSLTICASIGYLKRHRLSGATCKVSGYWQRNTGHTCTIWFWNETQRSVRCWTNWDPINYRRMPNQIIRADNPFGAAALTLRKKRTRVFTHCVSVIIKSHEALNCSFLFTEWFYCNIDWFNWYGNSCGKRMVGWR